MVVATLKTLTWGTVAAAVFSALLLACAGNSMPRMAGLVVDSLRLMPLAPNYKPAGPGARATSEGPRDGASTRSPSSH